MSQLLDVELRLPVHLALFVQKSGTPSDNWNSSALVQDYTVSQKIHQCCTL